MSEKVTRTIDERSEREIRSATHRRQKAIGMAKHKFADAIVNASLKKRDRVSLCVLISKYLENFTDSDGKPLVEDYDAVAKELSCIDAFSAKDSKEIPVSEIPQHSKVKSKSAPTDPVERAIESRNKRTKAGMNQPSA